jgi:hypothetical protein
VSGGDGDDVIDVSNDEASGSPDNVTCGGGQDTVEANGDDAVAENCETVDFRKF